MRFNFVPDTHRAGQVVLVVTAIVCGVVFVTVDNKMVGAAIIAVIGGWGIIAWRSLTAGAVQIDPEMVNIRGVFRNRSIWRANITRVEFTDAGETRSGELCWRLVVIDQGERHIPTGLVAFGATLDQALEPFAPVVQFFQTRKWLTAVSV